MLLNDGMVIAISVKTSAGPAYFQSNPRRLAISWMIHRSCRASPAAGEHGPRYLHAPIRVGEGARFLGKGRGRQHHIGVERGLGQEEILHDEVIEHRQRLASVIEIRIRHRRILPFHVHAADLAGVDGVHDLNDGEALLRIELLAPERLEELAHLGFFDRLVVGVDHRDEAASEAPWTLFWPRSGWSPVPLRPIWPVVSASAIKQRALSVPCTCWLMPMPQKMSEAREVAYSRATSRSVWASMPQTSAIRSE